MKLIMHDQTISIEKNNTYAILNHISIIYIL